MGASAVSIQAAIAATVLFGVVALLISPFSAIFVIVVGVMSIAFLATWGRRAQQGDVEGDGSESTTGRASGAER